MENKSLQDLQSTKTQEPKSLLTLKLSLESV